MKWFLFLSIFIASTMVFAVGNDTNATTMSVTNTYPNGSTATSSSNQTTGPSTSTMPAWQQALQPRTITTNSEQNTTTTRGANTQSTTSSQSSTHGGSLTQ